MSAMAGSRTSSEMGVPRFLEAVALLPQAWRDTAWAMSQRTWRLLCEGVEASYATRRGPPSSPSSVPTSNGRTPSSGRSQPYVYGGEAAVKSVVPGGSRTRGEEHRFRGRRGHRGRGMTGSLLGAVLRGSRRCERGQRPGSSVVGTSLWFTNGKITRRQVFLDRGSGARSRRAVGVAARSRRDLDHRQSESFPFICEWVRGTRAALARGLSRSYAAADTPKRQFLAHGPTAIGPVSESNQLGDLPVPFRGPLRRFAPRDPIDAGREM